LAECCVLDQYNMVGADINSLNFDIRPDALLFGETQSRIILSCSESCVGKIRKLALRFKAPFQVIGKTGGGFLRILNQREELIYLPLEEISAEWSDSLNKEMGG